MTDLAAPELKRCTSVTGVGKYKCKNWFSINDSRKWCEGCRTRSTRHQRTPQRKAYLKKQRKTTTFKASQKRYWLSDKGKANHKRQNDKVINKLSTSLGMMIKGIHPNPFSFPKLGIFVDNAAAQEHFESTFKPWMNWANHGIRYVNTLPNTTWQIGHRIPRAWFQHTDINEVKKAWSRTNLFAQCAVENTNANCYNILSHNQWLALKPIWPKQCDGMTDEEAWAWARDNVDNTTRAAARAAEAGPSDLGAAAFSTDDEDSGEDWF